MSDFKRVIQAQLSDTEDMAVPTELPPEGYAWQRREGGYFEAVPRGLPVHWQKLDDDTFLPIPTEWAIWQELQTLNTNIERLIEVLGVRVER